MDRLSSLQMAGSLGIAPGFRGANAKQPAHPTKSSHPNEDGVVDDESFSTVFKVIGIGGAGCNAVEQMIRQGVTGVEYICADTDAPALKNSSAGTKIQIITNSESGNKQSASTITTLAERDSIVDALRGANLVFVIAGMGGGTGTKGSTLVAEVTRDLGIFTVAIVTKPFESESQRMRIAEDGLEKLVHHVDSLIVISNESLKDIIGDQVSMPEAFRYTDTVLSNAVGSITDIVTKQGLVCVDFADVRTVLSEAGMGIMGFSTATGVDRAQVAAEQAVKSPLLKDVNLSGASRVLVVVTATYSQLREVYEVMDIVKTYACHDDLDFMIGTNSDASMGDQLRVTIFATGLGNKG
jgi:cell division protein FtsZ